MTATTRFTLDWYGGSSAVVDLHVVVENDETRYMLRYSSPLRPTMRSPSQEIAIGSDDLQQMSDDLDEFAARVGATPRTRGRGGGQPVAVEELAEVGSQFKLVLLPHILADLRERGCFVEIGIDEELIPFPWELIHDGEDFMCLKHYVGRYVNLRQTVELNGPAPTAPGTELGELRFLLVSVPRPRGGRGAQLEALTAAEAEAEAIIETLGAIGVRPRVLAGPDAKRTELLKVLREQYHVIHFAGHAMFDVRNPKRSALFLDDEEIYVGTLTRALSDQRSILCVVNACETARAGEAQDDGRSMTWSGQYNIYGLARAFLETGAYLLGSRWRLGDTSAKLFAERFYAALFKDGAPIGRAITEAREAAKDAAALGDYSWASYIYYGDPRVCFRRVAPEPRIRLRRKRTPKPAQPEPDRDELMRLSKQYEEIRASMPSGAERTARMSEIVEQAATLGADADVSALLSDLFKGGPGERIVGLGLVGAKPDARYFDHVLDAIEHSQSAFEQYQALQVARLIVSELSSDQTSALVGALTQQLQNEEFLGTDRRLLADDILARAGEATAVSGSPVG